MAVALRSLALWQRSPPAATVARVRLKEEGGIPGTQADTGYWMETVGQRPQKRQEWNEITIMMTTQISIVIVRIVLLSRVKRH